jgi:PhnB protein
MKMVAKHTTYLFSEDAMAQAQFYIAALGGEIVSVLKHGDLPGAEEKYKDKVLHLHLNAAGVNFYMCDFVREPIQYGNSILQNLEFQSEEEARSAFEKLADGGTIRAPLKMEFWGALHGQVQDKFGVLWMITTEVKGNPS